MKKRILVLGVILTCIFVCIPLFYEKIVWYHNIQSVEFPQKHQMEETLEGYEDEESLISYMIYNLKNKNMDYSLRGCAIGEIAEYFSLRKYVEYTGAFEGTNMIPPADTDSEAYYTISTARLSASYADVLTQLIDILSYAGTVELIAIQDGTPEDAGGKYYQKKETMCDILGARRLEEKSIYLQLDGNMMRLDCVLVKYRSFWKVLYFHKLSQDGIEVVDLENTDECFENSILVDVYENDILPCNYFILRDNSEQDPEELIHHFFLCLQREDVLTAMSYYEKDYSDVKLSKILEKQQQMALAIQQLYYDIFLSNSEELEWILSALESNSGELVNKLSSTNMLYINLLYIVEIKTNQDQAEYKIVYAYDGRRFDMVLHLINQDGWRISSVGM